MAKHLLLEYNFELFILIGIPVTWKSGKFV